MNARPDNLGALPFADYADADPNRLPLDEAPRESHTCACGRPATHEMAYGTPGGPEWAWNYWCPTHAASPQVHEVARITVLS